MRCFFPQLRFVLAVGCLLAAGPIRAAEADAAEEQMRLAEGLVSRNFHDLAKAELQKFLQANPDHPRAPQATLLLLECLRAGGKADEAVATIDRFRQRWPGHPKVPALLLLKCEILIGKDDAAGARAILAGLAGETADPATREAAAYFLAQADAKDGRTDAALEALAKLAGLPPAADRPFRAYAALGEGVLRQQKNDLAGAEAAYRRLAGAAPAPATLREEALYRLAEIAFLKRDYPAAVEGYGRMLKEFPSGCWAMEAGRRRAWALFHSGEYAKAAALADEWRGNWAGRGGGSDTLYLKGLCLAGQRKFGEALALFQGMQQQAGSDGEYLRLARHRAVFCLAGLEKWEETLAAGRAFLGDYPKAPEKADILYFQGEALCHQEKWADAAAALRQALDSFSGDWFFLDACAGRFGDCLGRMQKPRRELAAVYRALAGRTDVADRGAKLLRAGEVERECGSLDAAAADFQKLRGQFAGSPAARTATLRLAEVEAERGKYDAAAALVKELAAAGGESRGRILLFSGFLAHLQQKHAEAEKALREAVAALREDTAGRAEANFYLAASLLDQRREEEALALFRELLALPEPVRPRFSPELLFRLETLFFNHGRLDVSEAVCLLLQRSPEAAVADRGRAVLGRVLLAANRTAEAVRTWEELLLPSPPRAAAAPAAVQAEVASLLGEWAAQAGQGDRAVAFFQQALKLGGGGEAAARSRWGLAQIFHREGRLRQALEQAVGGFVLGDDPAYTPKTMFLAVQILVAQKQGVEARTTWHELAVRYPAFAEMRKDDPLVKGLPPAESGPEKTPQPPPADAQKNM